MERIPVNFTLGGVECSGYFASVFGTASQSWHLTVNHFYWGILQYTTMYGWVFHGNKGPELDDKAEEFGELMMAWYQ